MTFFFRYFILKNIYSITIDKFQISNKIEDLTNKRVRREIKNYVKNSVTIKIFFFLKQTACQKEIRTKKSILRHLFRLYLTR